MLESGWKSWGFDEVSFVELVGKFRYLCGAGLAAMMFLLASCNHDENSFRSLNLEATATGDDDTTELTLKVLVVGDSVSPRLSGFLNGRTFEIDENLAVIEATDVPYVQYEAAGIDMDGDYIVWSDGRNGNSDIFGYQISTGNEFAISTAAGSQLSPKVSGDYVVWQDSRNGNVDIFAYQFSTATEIPITTADRNQRFPQIDGDYVVWEDRRNSKAEIFAYQFSTATETQISNLSGEQWEPKISGDYIVWRSYENGFTDIHGYRISTASQFAISQASGSQFSPALSDEHVVWVDNRNGNDDIYAYEFSSGQELLVSNAAGEQLRPQVANGYVVWQDNRNGDFDIYAYRFDTSSEIEIGVASGSQVSPFVRGDHIVWQDSRNGNADIFAYRLSTAEVFQISDHITAQTLPMVNGNNFAWLDGRRGVVDIVLREGVSGTDRLVTTGFETPAAVVDSIATDDYKLILFGSDVFSDEVVLDVFDAALAKQVNMLGLGGIDTSLARALANGGRYSLSTTPATGCAPIEVVVSESLSTHSIFTGFATNDSLILENEDAVTRDELAIEIDASDSASPADWQVLATFSGNTCNTAKPAMVEFTDDNGTAILLDGTASVADDYAHWSPIRFSLLTNEVTYLLTLAVNREAGE